MPPHATSQLTNVLIANTRLQIRPWASTDSHDKIVSMGGQPLCEVIWFRPGFENKSDRLKGGSKKRTRNFRNIIWRDNDMFDD